MKSIKADLKCSVVQKIVFNKTMPGVKVNSFEPRNVPGEHLREDGVLYVNDICYGNQYPNSYLDIWYAGGEKASDRPTVIYIHGGGFIFGDKASGDPMAVSEGQVSLYAELARQGYNVIGMNYALAPQYRFPVQLAQVDQMLCHLVTHAEELCLDMNRVFLGGGSAGACLSEIYGALLTNDQYAKHLGITPSVEPDRIKGLILDEAALSNRNFNEDMNAMMGCWLGADDLLSDKISMLLDPTKWIKTYIPTFINSSNQEPYFADSAEDLKSVLERIGIEYTNFYRTPEYEKLEHGYLNNLTTSPSARECFSEVKRFICKHQ